MVAVVHVSYSFFNLKNIKLLSSHRSHEFSKIIFLDLSTPRPLLINNQRFHNSWQRFIEFILTPILLVIFAK